MERFVHGRERAIPAGQRGKMNFGAANSRWPSRMRRGVNTNDGVLRRQFLVGHFDGAVAMQHSLKAVDRFEPCEIQQAAERLREIPGDDHSIQLSLYIVRAEQSRFEEYAEERGLVKQDVGRLCQLVEPTNR